METYTPGTQSPYFTNMALITMDTQKAIVIYESLCENYVEPCHNLGEAYASLSRYDLAEKAYLTAARSGDLRAYGNLSILYYNKKWTKHDFTKAKYWN